MELDEEGQHVKWAPFLDEEDAVLKSAVDLQVEELQLREGCVYSTSGPFAGHCSYKDFGFSHILIVFQLIYASLLLYNS